MSVIVHTQRREGLERPKEKQGYRKLTLVTEPEAGSGHDEIIAGISSIELLAIVAVTDALVGQPQNRQGSTRA